MEIDLAVEKEVNSRVNLIMAEILGTQNWKMDLMKLIKWKIEIIYLFICINYF